MAIIQFFKIFLEGTRKMFDPFDSFEKGILPNGLEIHSSHLPNVDWQYVGFVVHSGANRDPVGLEGLAHFVEHLVSENTGIVSEEIYNFFRACGGYASLGVTNYESTKYDFFLPAEDEKLLKAFEIFGDMLLRCQLKKEIKKTREIIIQEFLGHFPFNYQLALRQREIKTVFAGYPQERFIRPLGSRKTIQKINQKNLQDFYVENYHPKNISLVTVGKLKVYQIMDLLFKTPFEIEKSGDKTQLPAKEKEVGPLKENRYVFQFSKHRKENIPQTSCFKSVAKLPGIFNFWAIDLFSILLSRTLSREIRGKRSLAYEVGVSFKNFINFYEILTECPNFKTDCQNEIEEVVTECIESLKSNRELFQKAKEDLLLKYSLIDLSGRTLLNLVMEQIAVYQRIEPIYLWKREIQKVSFSEIQKIVDLLQAKNRWSLLKVP